MASTGPSKAPIIVSWVLRLAIAAILGMAAFVKLSGDPGSAAMFEYLGAPWARVVVGAAEALAVVLVLVPKTVLIGAGLSAMLMVGAVGSHLTKLGVSIDPEKIAGGDADKAEQLAAAGLEGPSMFAMGVAVLIASLVVIGLKFVGRGADSAASASP